MVRPGSRSALRAGAVEFALPPLLLGDQDFHDPADASPRGTRRPFGAGTFALPAGSLPSAFAKIESVAHWIEVNDRMQQGYRYALTAPAGRDFHESFTPDLAPAEMLTLGVFGGKYMTDCRDEFPAEWFAQAQLSQRRNPALNFFGVEAGQSLSVWRARGWIHPDDPRGWFQWYCRYFLGRRMPGEDERQIGRWRAMRRHVAQLRRHCEPGDWRCRPRQRQALLQWAYDSRRL